MIQSEASIHNNSFQSFKNWKELDVIFHFVERSLLLGVAKLHPTTTPAEEDALKRAFPIPKTSLT